MWCLSSEPYKFLAFACSAYSCRVFRRNFQALQDLYLQVKDASTIASLHMANLACIQEAVSQGKAVGDLPEDPNANKTKAWELELMKQLARDMPDDRLRHFFGRVGSLLLTSGLPWHRAICIVHLTIWSANLSSLNWARTLDLKDMSMLDD